LLFQNCIYDAKAKSLALMIKFSQALPRVIIFAYKQSVPWLSRRETFQP
jgi:hypothetical protein